MPRGTDDAEFANTPGMPEKRRHATAIWGLLLGIVFLAAAVRVVIRSPALVTAQYTLQHSPWWVFAGLLALPLANLLLTSATFLVLTNRHGRVRFVEMTGLIAGSWLFSVVGMFGRMAYHRRVHDVPIKASMLVLVQALACSFVGVLILLALTLLGSALRLDDGTTILVLGIPALALAIGTLFLRVRDQGNHRWRWTAALMFRYLDMGVWGLRYLLVFGALFGGISAVSAAGFAAAAQAAMLLPIQIGLREWVIGILGSVLTLPGSATAETTVAASLSHGLLADLVNRAAELVVALPLGTLAAIWLGRRWNARTPKRAG